MNNDELYHSQYLEKKQWEILDEIARYVRVFSPTRFLGLSVIVVGILLCADPSLSSSPILLSPS